MTRVALVIPWYGEEQTGGAELQARQVALRLAVRGHCVEVLTTRGQSFLSDWSVDYFPEDACDDNGVTVRRFSLDRRDKARFDAINEKLLSLSKSELIPGVSPLADEEESAFVSDNINSADLIRYLQTHHESYDAFLFIPYLYGPILQGIPAVAGHKVYLQPCLHDEPYAYLDCVRRIFRGSGRVLFNSSGEFELALQLYGPGIWSKSTVIGEGIEHDSSAGQAESAPASLPSDIEFVFCLGRRDATKNTNFLVDVFKRYKIKSGLALVLAGPGEGSFTDKRKGIHDLGLVSPAEKRWLLKNCRALLQPSVNESYSRVMMEAWFAGRPVIVSERCLATATAVRESGGGWTADDAEQWLERLREIEQATSNELAEFGRRGEVYADNNADWNRVVDRYETVMDLVPSSDAAPLVSRRLAGKTIHQVLPNMSYGDAISDSALALRDFLCARGAQSDIFVQHLDERMFGLAKVFEIGCLDGADGVICHYSIGSALMPYVVAHDGRRALIYHNITPPVFFEPYDEKKAQLLRNGQEELRELAPRFDCSWGASQFNTVELADNGFGNAACLPLTVDPSKWAESVDAGMMSLLQDGETKNILFVGRLVPNKCQGDLLLMMAALVRLNPDVRLCMVGGGEPEEPYVRFLNEYVEELGLEDNVLISGQVSHAILQAFYRTADVYVSMSEHEGFGVPLIEAMWFDVPVVAFKSSAVAETLGDAAFMFTSKRDMTTVAALVNVVLTDASVRRRMISAQRNNRLRFTRQRLESHYEQLLEQAFA